MPGRGCPGAAAQAQRLLFHNSHRVPAGHIGTVLRTGRRRGSFLGCPAPSRVCPRTSTGRPGVHVRSGGRLSRAATHLWIAQTSRVACGHSRDGSLSRWTSGEVLGPSSRRSRFALDGTAGQDAACCGPRAWRMATGPHGVPPINLKPLGVIGTLRGAPNRPQRLGRRRNPCTDNLHQHEAFRHSSRLEERKPVCRTGLVAGSEPAGGASVFQPRRTS